MATPSSEHGHAPAEGMPTSGPGFDRPLTVHRDASYQDDEFWAAFELDDDYVPTTPWYRKTARVFAIVFLFATLATGALGPWGNWLGRRDNVSEPAAIVALAEQTVAESPYGWLVSDVRVRDIPNLGVAAFVHSSPADGIITLDVGSWSPRDLRATVAHEIGHLIDFAAYREAVERRDGLPAEVWAECAAVDAGFRDTDNGRGATDYHCTDEELEQYRFAVSRLGEICRHWGEPICRPIAPIS